MKILLVADESAGAKALQSVVGAGHELVRVLTPPPGASGNSVSRAAADLGIPVGDAAIVRSALFATDVRALGVDVLLNVHALHVINAAVMKAPRIGSLNLHPGPLPEYAGLNTVSWAIYNGAIEYGATLHWMTNAIDGGDIAYASRFPLPAETTALRLMSQTVREGMGLLDRLLHQLSADPAAVPRVAQDLSRRRYYARDEAPQSPMIDWKRTAQEVTRFVLACDYGLFRSPWGHPHAVLNGREVEVLSTERTGVRANAPAGTVGRREQGSVWVAAGDEWVGIKRVVAVGETMPAAEAIPETASPAVPSGE